MVTRLLIICAFVLYGGAVYANSLTVITYHDVVADPGHDGYAVSRSEFVAQMDYLKDQGYKPVSLSFLNSVYRNKARLPKKAILLTFDDGLISYHDFVAPLLKIYKFPSVAAVVTGWLDGENIPPVYKNKMMNWSHVKNLSRSKYVEFISHTHSMHRGLPTNSYGNERPAVITRQFFPFNQSYETVQDYRQRLRYDLGVSVLRFVKKLGKSPIGIAWPYGKFNRVSIEEATKLGMVFQLTLEDGPTPTSQFPELNRIMMVNNPSIEDFANELAYKYVYDEALRFVEVELDPFLGKARWQQEEMLSTLLDELQRRKVNMILISPFSKNNKVAFFRNSQVKLGTDILNRVLRQMQDRVPIDRLLVKIPGGMKVDNYDRLYENLASLSEFHGMVFSRPKSVNPETAARIKRIVSQYRPRVKFGILGTQKVAYNYDFVVYPIDAESAPKRMPTLGPKLHDSAKQVYIYLTSNQSNSGRTLVKAIQSLQVAGIKHYGYKLDERTYAKVASK